MSTTRTSSLGQQTSGTLTTSGVTNAGHRCPVDLRPRLTVSRAGGFTLIELVVIVTLTTLGALMLVPALARVRTNSPTLQCMNNLRQLQCAQTMYTADNGGRLVPNQGAFSTDSGRWATGRLTWGTSVDNTNVQYLLNGALGPYTAKALAIYKCPADKIPALNGPRIRSYSMNGFVGGTIEWDVYGYSTYRVFLKDSDFTAPGAAKTFVFVDEHPDSIDDEVLGLHMAPAASWPAATTWDDVPASHHNGMGVLSFADGHVEIHEWLDANTRVPVSKVTPCYATGLTSVGDNAWLSARASAPR